MSRTVDNRAYYAKQTAARNTLIEPVNYIVNLTSHLKGYQTSLQGGLYPDWWGNEDSAIADQVHASNSKTVISENLAPAGIKSQPITEWKPIQQIRISKHKTVDISTQTEEFLLDKPSQARKIHVEQKLEQSRSNLAQYLEKAGFSDVEHSNKVVDRTRISTEKDLLSNKDSVKNVKKPATAWFLGVNKSKTRPDSFEILEKPTVPPIPTYTPKKHVFRAAPTSKKASREPNSQQNFSRISSSTASKTRGIAKGVQAGGRDRSSDLLSMKDFYESLDSRNGTGLRGNPVAASVNIRDQNLNFKLTSPEDELSDTELIKSDRGSLYMPYTGLFSHSVSSSRYASAHEKSMQVEEDLSSPIPGYSIGISSARSTGTLDRSNGLQSRNSPINTNVSSPRSVVPKPIPINGVYFLAQEFMSSPVLDCLDSSIPEERSSIEDISKSMLRF